jgi:hypothetical protein
VTDGFEFLGFHIAMRWDKRYGYFPRVKIPKAKAADLRHRIKQHTRGNTTSCGLGHKLASRWRAESATNCPKALRKLLPSCFRGKREA